MARSKAKTTNGKSANGGSNGNSTRELADPKSRPVDNTTPTAAKAGLVNGSSAQDDVPPGTPPAETPKPGRKSSFNAVDDPVRMYLMQMGEIPMLTRQEEISAAMQIEYWRTRFRTSMMASDLILQGAVVALEKVRDGEVAIGSDDRSLGHQYV